MYLSTTIHFQRIYTNIPSINFFQTVIRCFKPVLFHEQHLFIHGQYPHHVWYPRHRSSVQTVFKIKITYTRFLRCSIVLHVIFHGHRFATTSTSDRIVLRLVANVFTNVLTYMYIGKWSLIVEDGSPVTWISVQIVSSVACGMTPGVIKF